MDAVFTNAVFSDSCLDSVVAHWCQGMTGPLINFFSLGAGAERSLVVFSGAKAKKLKLCGTGQEGMDIGYLGS